MGKPSKSDKQAASTRGRGGLIPVCVNQPGGTNKILLVITASYGMGRTEDNYCQSLPIKIDVHLLITVKNLWIAMQPFCNL